MKELTPVLTFFTRTPDDLALVVEDIKEILSERTVLLLEGPVGAGKTELVKRLTRSLNLPETASPSFAIHHRYESVDEHTFMDHVDLYRLENEDDLESTGFWDLFGAPKGLVVIEWSDRLNQELLPMNWKLIKVNFELLSDPQQRKIVISI